MSTLVFIPTIKDAGKFVGCRAADMLTGEGSLEDGWELTITCKENIVNTWSDIIRHKYLPYIPGNETHNQRVEMSEYLVMFMQRAEEL